VAWHGALHATTVAESLEREKFIIRAQIIWAKERLVIGRDDYHWQHEPCWHAVRDKGHWMEDRKQTKLWSISSGGQDPETARHAEAGRMHAAAHPQSHRPWAGRI
jgi:hypothetical protein